MPIVRIEPGGVAPWGGRYALVGHYGEPTDASVWRDAGQRLPLLAGPAELGPFWFVLVEEANEQARVA
jgi:hypothetical protein